MDQTPEEIAAELAASKVEIKEEEVRAKVIEEFGFDPEIDQERIDKLVTKEVENQKKLSAAIGQKIKHRTEAEALKNDPRLKPVIPPEKKEEPQDVSAIVKKQLEERDLEALEYSDDLKKEIRRIVNITGVSVRQAARDPYIVAKIADYEKQQKIDEATTTRTNRSGGSSKNFKFDSPPDVDMSTVEGRKTWEEYKAAMKKEGN